MNNKELKEYIQREYYYVERCIEELQGEESSILDFLLGKRDALKDIVEKIGE